METKNDVLEMDAGGGGFDKGRRRAMRKIAVGVGALAGLSVLPEQWTRPLIGRIVIPAHAATSGEVEEPAPQPQGCALGAGCYLISAPPEVAGDSFTWPGGSGPHLVTGYPGSEVCSGEPSHAPMVLASDASAASTALGEETVIQLTVSGTPPGCSFYVYFA